MTVTYLRRKFVLPPSLRKEDSVYDRSQKRWLGLNFFEWFEVKEFPIRLQLKNKSGDEEGHP